MSQRRLKEKCVFPWRKHTFYDVYYGKTRQVEALAKPSAYSTLNNKSAYKILLRYNAY